MSEKQRDTLVLAILALVPTLLFLDVLLGVNAFYARDISQYYVPAKKVLREIVLSGHFPYWNPLFAAGQPMAANPEHEVFYPLTWLILLPDYLHAVQILPLLHIFIATFAMYALLRSMELGRTAACIGALSFGVGGVVCSNLILFPILFSLAWLPLTCLYTRRFLLHRLPRDFALAAFFLGVQLLVGEPTTAFQSGVLLGLYALHRGRKGAMRNVAFVGAISIAALCVAAVQVIPTLDHFRDTARARGIEFDLVSRWSMPFHRLTEVFYPYALGRDAAHDHAQYWAWPLYGEDTKVPFYFSIYSGLLLTVMAAAGVLARMRGTMLLLVTAAISIVAAAGANTPLLRILYDAGARTIRYPEKFVLMFVFALVVFGAHALDRFLRGDEAMRRHALRVALATTIAAAAIALFSLTDAYERAFRAFWSIPSTERVDWVLPVSRQDWFYAAGRGMLLVLLLASFTRVRRPLWIVLGGLFAVADLAPVAIEVSPRVPMEFYREVPAVVRQFPEKRDDFRIFHIANWSGETRAGHFYRQRHPDFFWRLRNALVPFIPAQHGLHIAIPGDFDLTEVTATDDFTRAVWALEDSGNKDWLNIVVPMSNIRYLGIYRKPEEAMAETQGRPHVLQPVKFVEGEHQPRHYFADQMETARDWREFVRKLSAKRYSRRVAFVGADPFLPGRGTVRGVEEWPNGARIDVEAEGRAFLVMSVTPHRHWRISIDGRPVPAVVTNIGYQGVIVPAGRHRVEMTYRNPFIAIGAAISIVTLLALAYVFCRMRGL